MVLGLPRWMMRTAPPRYCRAHAFSAGKPNENAAVSRIEVEANRPNQNRLNQTVNRTAFITGVLPTVPCGRAFFMFSFARLMVWTDRPTD
jgi:hypothetical protein